MDVDASVCILEESTTVLGRDLCVFSLSLKLELTFDEVTTGNNMLHPESNHEPSHTHFQNLLSC